MIHLKLSPASCLSSLTHEHVTALADHNNLLRTLWNASTEYQDNDAILHLEASPDITMDALQPVYFVLVKYPVNKEDPLYKGPFRVLPPRVDHSQHMYVLENMVEDTIDTVHMRNIVPLIGLYVRAASSMPQLFQCSVAFDLLSLFLSAMSLLDLFFIYAPCSTVNTCGRFSLIHTEQLLSVVSYPWY